MDHPLPSDYTDFLEELQSAVAERVDVLRERQSAAAPSVFLDREKFIRDWPDLAGRIVEEFR